MIRRFDKRQPVAVGHYRDGISHMVEIIERLPHAHENNIRHRAQTIARDETIIRRRQSRKIAKSFPRDQELGDDFRRGQIADQLLGSGMAESAAQRAADLARNAEGATVAFRDIDAFDLGAFVRAIAGSSLHQPFPGAIAGHLFSDDFGPRKRKSFGRACRASPC